MLLSCVQKFGMGRFYLKQLNEVEGEEECLVNLKVVHSFGYLRL
jgi:hypothetical protein